MGKRGRQGYAGPHKLNKGFGLCSKYNVKLLICFKKGF